jgi:UDP-glucose 4-epimerase
MTVLVTGGTGWIGSYVVKDLVDRGERVVAFDAAGDPSRYKEFRNVQVVRGDILDFPGLFECIRDNDIDRIIHLAGIVQADSRKNPRLFQKINCEGLVNVMEAARLAGVRRLVFSSTTVVYGETTCASVDEDYPPSPANTYAASKLFGELFLEQYRRAHGLDYVAVRFGHVFGPGKLKGTPVFKDPFEYPAKGEKYVLASGGDHQWNWSYVKDCGSAVVAACFAENPAHRVLNICEGARHSVRDIANLISTEIIPGAQFEIGPGNLEGHPQESLVEVGRAERVLSWKHRSMREAIQDYIATRP